MADDHLRRLERDAAGGDVEARARLLAERVRQGALPVERAGLAALAGDLGAREALSLPEPPTDLRAWERALRAFGQLAWTLCASEVCRAMLESVEAPADADLSVGGMAYLDRARLRRGLEAIAAWVGASPEARRTTHVSLGRSLGILHPPSLWLRPVGLALWWTADATRSEWSAHGVCLRDDLDRPTAQRFAEEISQEGGEVALHASGAQVAVFLVDTGARADEVANAIRNAVLPPTSFRSSTLSAKRAQWELNPFHGGGDLLGGLPGVQRALRATVVPWALGED